MKSYEVLRSHRKSKESLLIFTRMGKLRVAPAEGMLEDGSDERGKPIVKSRQVLAPGPTPMLDMVNKSGACTAVFMSIRK